MRAAWRWAVIALGAALRLVFCLATWRHNSPELRFAQADGYMAAAQFLHAHGHIPDPVFTPAYMYLVAAVQAIAPSHAVPVLLLIQWMLGTACIPLTMWLAQRCGGTRAAIIAGLLVALDPLLLIQPALILTEALYTPLILAATCLFIMALRAAPPRRLLTCSVFAGVLIGLGVLTRSVGIMVLPAAYAALLLDRRHTPRQRWQAAIALSAVAAIAVLPLCLQNRKLYGHFAISSSSGFNLAALVVGPVK